MRCLLAGAAAAVLLLALPTAATACSCAAPESQREAARGALRYSDLAFIGVLKSVRRIGDRPSGPVVPAGGPAFFRYRVLHAYGGDPGRFVRVRSDLSTASCGLPRHRGQRFAMGADRSPRGMLEAGLCSLVSPRALRRAAEESGLSGRGRADC